MNNLGADIFGHGNHQNIDVVRYTLASVIYRSQ